MLAVVAILTLAIMAYVAAMISAMTGVAGGVLLLSGLILIVPPIAVVPLHGVVQFCAGASRMVFYGKHVVWPVVNPFLLAMVPGAAAGAVGLRFLKQLEPSWLLLAIAMVIVFTALPSPQRQHQAQRHRLAKGGLVALGFICGFLGMFLGSTGPLVSGWLLRHGILKEAHIGSKSVMQGLAHLTKVPFFIWALDFEFLPYIWALIAMIVMVMLGTITGRWALGKLSSERFAFVTRILLGVIALRIIITEVPKII